MKHGHAISVIEAAYRIELSTEQWLERIAALGSEALGSAQGAMALRYDASSGDWIEAGVPALHGLSPEFVREFFNRVNLAKGWLGSPCPCVSGARGTFSPRSGRLQSWVPSSIVTASRTCLASTDSIPPAKVALYSSRFRERLIQQDLRPLAPPGRPYCRGQSAGHSLSTSNAMVGVTTRPQERSRTRSRPRADIARKAGARLRRTRVLEQAHRVFARAIDLHCGSASCQGKKETRSDSRDPASALKPGAT